MKAFIQAANEIHKQTHAFLYKCKCRFNQNHFTKSNGKITFPMLISHIISLPRKSTQMEVNKLFLTLDAEPVAKQSMTEARMKINYTAFTMLDETLRNDFYKNFKPTLIHGFMLAAFDGSYFDVPYGAKKHFGEIHAGGSKAPKAQGAALVDVLNEIVLDADLQPYTANERDIAYELISKQNENTEYPRLYLFDRGFPSAKLIKQLTGLGKHFLMRVSETNFHKVVNEANLPDQTVVLGNKVTVRVINVTLSTGKTEKLITNVMDSAITPENFREIYNYRWGVEVKFLEFKQRLEIEKFSHHDKLLIMQDFYATILVSNLIALAKYDAKVELAKKERSEKAKYEHEINTNIAVGVLTTLIIEAVVTEDEKRSDELFQKAFKLILKNTVPIRPGRSNPRKVKYKSAKHAMNKKSAL